MDFNGQMGAEKESGIRAEGPQCELENRGKSSKADGTAGDLLWSQQIPEDKQVPDILIRNKGPFGQYLINRPETGERAVG